MTVYASETAAWKKLAAKKSELANVSLRDAFNQNPNRARDFSFSAGPLFIDLSKNLIDAQTLDLFAELADEVGLKGAIDAQFSGKHINNTEDRAVLHTALRDPEFMSGSLIVDGQDVIGDVHKTLNKMYDFAEKVRAGVWRSISGKQFKTIVNIGIGGSDLGPVMVYEALRGSANSDITAKFVSNIDPTDLAEKLKGLDPETTLFIVASKTFTTLETLTNARLAKKWLIDELAKKGIFDSKGAVRQHFIAVSTALDKVEEFGIDPNNAFGFWNWVGGRYSVDSAVGTALAIVYGKSVFRRFLDGFHQIDEHFKNSDFRNNAVVLMGMLNVFYVNFWGAHSHAVLPYNQYLHRFPAYLQQLTMESNGKTIRKDGTRTDVHTGEIFWGEPGTNGQHAFYQLIHQGTRLIPADFIAVANPVHPSKDYGAKGDEVNDVHELFLANFFAQTKALAFGKTKEEVEAEGVRPDLVNAKVFEGNRPTTSIMAVSLTPEVVGALIALYEQITFVQGVVWGLNSFDQWGVELGKVLAMQIYPAISKDNSALIAQDASTQNLINYYRTHRR
ncbi:MAG: glucose-6-phosphate isomerase [Candidatus Ancillula sp.]|jgi:glucose-6-phosphate isomerase|nr:glucose-6-phosphate isomerase [Candidatus Ancillula sp.]